MTSDLCFHCFKIKGKYEVCPFCGYIEGTPPKQASYLIPGTVLKGRYIIGTCIGSGGFGITYRAYDAVLSIMVAVKELFPARLVNRAAGETKVGICSGDKKDEYEIHLQRFLQEAKNMAIFSKEEDIVNVYAFFEENNTAYIVMEYIEGQLLKDYMRQKGRIPVEEAVTYIVPILRALDKIHRKQIIHKDISPDNIFLMGEGRIKIFDFGAASFLNEENGSAIIPVVIKVGYAAPEQYLNEQVQGPFMDIYSVGAIFYEMITGIKPEEGSDRYVKDELKRPSSLGVKIDRNMEKILLKALAVKMEERFQTAGEFAQAILNDQKVYEPGEAETKRANKRAMFSCIAVLFVMIAIIGGWIGYRLHLQKGKLNIADIKEDTLTVWLKVEETEEGAEASLLKENFEKFCPAVTLDVQEIPQDEYEEKLNQACKDDTLPDVFATDTLQAEQYCSDLAALYQTLPYEEYQYLSENLKETSPYEIPTGLDVAVVYENYEKYMKNGDTPDTTVLVENLDSLIGDYEIRKDYAKFGSDTEKLAILFGGISDFAKVSSVTLEATPSREIVVAPVTGEESSLQAVYTGYYGVNAKSTKNRQTAGMVCISYLLGKAMQEEVYLQGNAGIPLQKDVWQAYQKARVNDYTLFLKQEQIKLYPDYKSLEQWYEAQL